jgi:hypothetical protein
MKSSAHQLLMRAVILLAMAGFTGNFAHLQAQAIPARLAGADRIPPGLMGHADDARQPPRGRRNQADLVQILNQRGVSVDAQELAANSGRRRLAGSRRVPSEMEIPRADRANRNQPNRPSRAALLQRLRQLPGGAARLDAARRRGAPVGTSTGQAPLRLDGGDSYSLAYDDLVVAEGLTSIPLTGEPAASQTNTAGDWSTYLYPPGKWSDSNGNRVSLSGATVYASSSQTIYRLGKDACATMLLNVPVNGWYIVFYTMQIQSGAKLVVSTGFFTNTILNQFTGDGSWHAYPTLVEMQAGYHFIKACGDTAGKSARFLWSGAYDLP